MDVNLGRGGISHEAVEAQEGLVATGSGVVVHVACGRDADEDKVSTAKRYRMISEVGMSRAVGGHGMGREAVRCCQGERVAVEEDEDRGEAEAAASDVGRLSFDDGSGDLA